MRRVRGSIARAAAAGLAFVAWACGSPAAPAEDLPVVRLARGSHSALLEPRRLVIRSRAELEEVWAATFRTQSHPPALPVIDFAEHMVVLVSAGARPTSGFCISVESAAASGAVVTLTVLTIAPPGGTAVLQVITTPFEIVRVPARGEIVTFVERSRAGHCG